ncbi:MAG TPA: prepilin-type N-terminal cleavage/methylation domain-containing protein [Longimicrobiales bacterium]|jgi:prepilin-type N-terminal cleavage/methylation domain-containing protein
MRSHRAGFSIVELLTVIAIAGVLLGLAGFSFGRLQARRGAMSARDSFVMLAARARAVAIERGTTARLELDPGAGMARIQYRRAAGVDTVVESLHFRGEFDAALALAVNPRIVLCFTPRGYTRGGGSCTGPESLPDTVTFARGANVARAVIRPLGQVARL